MYKADIMIKTIKKFKLPRIVANFQNRERIILRDFLALERTSLANERTLFAYVRVSLYLIIGGIAFLKLDDFKTMIWLGYVCFAFSVFLLIFGFIRYNALRRRLSKFYASIDLSDNDDEDDEDDEEDEKP